MRILIADDHRLIVDDLLDEISRIYPEAFCIGTSDPMQVEALFAEHDFDVAILDIDMPGITGIELAKRLLARKPRLNIIYITGFADFALETYETFASAFLVKPIRSEKLKDALENLRHPVSRITDDMIEQEMSGNALIGKRIAKYREERGMTRDELKDKMGVTVQTISRWESGKRLPDVVTFMRLAHVLAIDPGKLMEGDIK